MTAQAWAICDGRSGDLLWGKHSEVPRDIASLTKMMTLYVAGKCLKKGLVSKEDLVEVSTLAVSLRGTSAWLRVGDLVALGDLLYGMMLPSGNDAACAIAEHLGKLFVSRKQNNKDTPLGAFIKQMNVQARRLNMRNSRFRNPHGLPLPCNSSTPSDLGVLGSAVLAEPGLAAIVRTKKWFGTALNREGLSRELVWNSTNLLLGQETVTGLKTGTTPTAGPCLTASFELGGYSLVVTVLKCRSAEKRWGEALRLVQWAVGRLAISSSIVTGTFKLRNLARV